MADKVDLTKGQKQRLALLLKHTTEMPSREWYRSGEFDTMNRRQTDLVNKGLLEEDLEHGYRYRLTVLGREIAQGLNFDYSVFGPQKSGDAQ